MKVCVLGCGPAGLLAAYACVQRGCRVSIVSKKLKSKIPGAVFLHEPIPYLTAPVADGVVKFIKHGTKRGYAQKVYGNEDADCSWDLFPEGERPAWSMFKLYDQLWEQFEDGINDQLLNHASIERILTMNFDFIITTIPAPFICYNEEHKFSSQAIYVLNKTADPSLRNGIVYNGDLRDSWYRTSRLFGAEATESARRFPTKLILELGAQTSSGYKPLQTNCDCFPSIRRVGRFGRWEKGILVHHAYKHTVQILEEWM
jgi:hypothetical protein